LSTLDPFQIPTIAPYPSLPAPIPTPTEGNPISYAKEKQAAQAKNDDATSVWGCLQLARTRFQQNPGTHSLVIASDMENNTSVDYTADFQSSQALKDVHVAVGYFYCSNARSCQSTTAQWQNIFTSSGAASVKFSDPVQSKTLKNLFGGGA
jgi:hypothetical protein